VLVIYAMTLELQDAGAYERSLTALRDRLGDEAVAFFARSFRPTTPRSTAQPLPPRSCPDRA